MNRNNMTHLLVRSRKGKLGAALRKTAIVVVIIAALALAAYRLINKKETTIDLTTAARGRVERGDLLITLLQSGDITDAPRGCGTPEEQA